MRILLTNSGLVRPITCPVVPNMDDDIKLPGDQWKVWRVKRRTFTSTGDVLLDVSDGTVTLGKGALEERQKDMLEEGWQREA